MTNRLIGIYDGLTDTYIEREATDLEQAEIDKRETESAAKVIELENAEKAKQLAKEELLNKLGITEDEAKLLLG
jgi:hypothetical protein